MYAKRKKLTFGKLFVICISFLCAVCYFVLFQNNEVKMTSAQPYGKTIVIDAGHDGLIKA